MLSACCQIIEGPCVFLHGESYATVPGQVTANVERMQATNDMRFYNDPY